MTAENERASKAEAAGVAAGGEKKVSKRPDVKAIGLMRERGLCLRLPGDKCVGAFPGLEPGFRFWSRAEMCVAGCHFPPVAGIDTARVRHPALAGGEGAVATSVVVGGWYEDDVDGGDVRGDILLLDVPSSPARGRRQRASRDELRWEPARPRRLPRRRLLGRFCGRGSGRSEAAPTAEHQARARPLSGIGSQLRCAPREVM